MKTVMLDAGHGGLDSGAITNLIRECDLNLLIAMSIGAVLNKYAGPGINVLYTREKDSHVSLSKRIEALRAAKPDAFVSIHCNAAGIDLSAERTARVSGFEVYWRDNEDKPLADTIFTMLIKTGLRSRGVFQDVARLGKRLTVLNDLPAPSCLVEVGYITSPTDLKYIVDNAVGISELIAKGILEFLGEIKNGDI